MAFLRFASLSIVTFLVAAGRVEAQDARELHREVAAAHGDAVAAAKALRDDLAALLPAVAGWTCEAVDRPGGAVRRWISAIPSFEATCRHGDQSLAIRLILDRSAATALCRNIASTRRGIESGGAAARQLRFFDGTDWQVKRSEVDLEGCAAGVIAISGGGGRSVAALAQGPSAVDVFAERLVTSDSAPVLARADTLGQEAALGRLMTALDAQSRLMDATIPTPLGATRTALFPLDDPRLPRPPTPMILIESPGATVDLDVGGCRLSVAVAASPYALYDATEVATWGRRRGEDGSVSGAHVRRNSARVVGRARVDGTGIEAVVDGSVVVRVMIPGNRPCARNPGIVQRLFDEIVAHDLSVFATP